MSACLSVPVIIPLGAEMSRACTRAYIGIVYECVAPEAEHVVVVVVVVRGVLFQRVSADSMRGPSTGR